MPRAMPGRAQEKKRARAGDDFGRTSPARAPAHRRPFHSHSSTPHSLMFLPLAPALSACHMFLIIYMCVCIHIRIYMYIVFDIVYVCVYIYMVSFHSACTEDP